MADTATSIMQRLRAETSDLHSHAESRVLQREIAKGQVDRQAFVAYLGQLYHVHGALEDALENAGVRHPIIAAMATADRMRIPDLDRDLAHYGIDPAVIEPGSAAGRFTELVERASTTNPVALLGALYVLEGSTNGGRFLANVLRTSWGVDGEGLSYLDPYGDRQPEQWASFRREMDAASFEGGQQDAVVEMAKRTFEAIAEVSDEVSAETR
jgi:heme oxygenase